MLEEDERLDPIYCLHVFQLYKVLGRRGLIVETIRGIFIVNIRKQNSSFISDLRKVFCAFVGLTLFIESGHASDLRNYTAIPT